MNIFKLIVLMLVLMVLSILFGYELSRMHSVSRAVEIIDISNECYTSSDLYYITSGEKE